MTEKIDLTQISQSSATLDQAIVWSGTDWVSRTVKAGSAGILAAARTFSLTGDMTWTTSFDGSANVTGVGTLATVNSNVGSFGSTSAIPILTVNAKGLVTAVSTAALGTAAIRNTGTSGNTIPFLDGANTWAAAQAFSAKITAATPTASIASITLPHGVAPTTPVNGDLWTTTAGLFARINSVTKTVAYLDSSITGSAASLTTARSITATGDLSWTTSFNGSANVTGAATLATVNANVGSFGSTTAVPIITVNAKGLVTALSTAALGSAAGQNIGTSGATIPLLSTANTWSTDQSFSGNVNVAGNLTVAGSTFAINSTNLEVSDAIITLAKDNSAGTAGFIGIKAERGTAGPDAYMVWDETTDQFEVQTATSDAQAGTIAVPFQASQFRSAVATGTAPLTVASTTVVTNLNADMVDGKSVGTSGDAIPTMAANNTWTGLQTFGSAVDLAGGNPTISLRGDKDSYYPAINFYGTNGTTGNNAFGSLSAYGTTMLYQFDKHLFRNSAAATIFATINASGIETTQFISTVATGTAPMTVTSSTQVNNLNANFVGGKTIGTSGSALPLLDGLNTWSANQTIINGMVAWSPTIQGSTKGSLHLGAQSTTTNTGAAITFEARDAGGAQAGIYVVTDGGYGTKMYFSTTNSYATGSQTSLSIDQNGNVYIPRGTMTVGGTISASNYSGTSSGTNTGDQTTISGNAGSATKLATARTIATTGDITQTLSFDGTANVSAPATLATVNANVGTYGASGTLNVPVLTVNAKGLVTGASQYALGNAATYAIGTSGATVPLQNGTNNWSMPQFFNMPGSPTTSQIFFNGTTQNWIGYNTAGVAPPSYSSRSTGTKIVLFPAVGAANVDYAIGIDNATQWYSVPSTLEGFKWYAGTNLVANLTGTGRFSAQNIQQFFVVRTLPVVVNDCVAIGGFTAPNGGMNLRVAITVGSNSFSISQTYNITSYYSGTANAWVVVQEESGSGPFNGQDVQLEILQGTGPLSMRIRRIAGTVAGDAQIHITNLGFNTGTLTEDASVSTPPVVTTIFNSAAPRLSNMLFGADNTGVTFFQGAAIYKRLGGGLTLRRHISEIDPVVENSAGTAQWKIWHAGNHGAGSGLDADLLDGQSGSYYAPISSPTFVSSVTSPTFRSTAGDGIRMRSAGGEYTVIQRNDANYFYLLVTALNDPEGSWNSFRPLMINLATGGVTSGSTWTINNPVTASQFNGPVNGNASSATILQTARSIAMTGDVTWSTSFNGSGNVTGTATLTSVNANVGTFGAAGAIPVLTINSKGQVTSAGVVSAPMVANFPAGYSYSTIYSSDVRNVVNPQTLIGYAKGVRFRFSALNDDSTAPWADVIDLSTYQDATGGLINALYVAKNSFQIQHKQQNGANGTTWAVKTLAYTDSDITGSSARLGGQLPSYYTDIPGRLGYTPANPGASNSFTGDQIFTNVRINGYGTNQWMQGNGDNATYAAQNTQLQIWWGLGIKAHDGVVRGVIDARAGTFDMLNGFRHNGAMVWSSSNDGAGSGLDADILDGQQGAYYADIPSRLGYAPVSRNGADTMKASLSISNADQSQSRLTIANTSASSYSWVAGTHNETQNNFSLYDNTRGGTRLVMDNNGTFFFRAGGLYVQASTTGVGLSMSNTNNAGNLGYAYAQFGTHATVTNNWHIGSGGDGTFTLWNGNWGNGILKLSVGVSTSSFATPLAIGTLTPASMLHVQASPNVDGQLKYQVIVRNNDPITTNPVAGIIFHNNYTTAGDVAGMGGIAVGKLNNVSGEYHSYLALYTRYSGNPTSERLRINHVGYIGINTTAPAAMLDVSNSQATFGLTESFMRLSNTATNGQTPLDFYVAGTFRGRIRADYVGNMNYVVSGGTHSFFVNGDAGLGGINTFGLDTAGRAIFGNTTNSHGAIRLLGPGLTEGNIYHDTSYGIRMDTQANTLPIAIEGSRLDIFSPVNMRNSLSVASNFISVSNGNWGGIRGGTGPADPYHGIIMRGDVTDIAGTVTTGDLMCLYDYSGIFNFRQWNGTNANNLVATIRPGGSTLNTDLTVNGGITLNGSISASGPGTFSYLVTNSNGAGTNIRIGDDAWLGDINLANGLQIMGNNDATSGQIQFGNAGGRLGVDSNGPLRYNVTAANQTVGFRVVANFPDAGTWSGRIISSNTAVDKAVFIGNWNNGTASAPNGSAIVGAHNNALNAWADLFLNCNTDTAGGVARAATLFVGGKPVLTQTSGARPGVTRLYRREDDSQFNVQTYWNGSRWVMYGYNGDAEHAGVLVDYANSAGSAATATTATSANAISGIPLSGLSQATVANVPDTNLDGGASKYLRWRNYGNGHIIFDASSGTSPSGSAIDRTTAQVGWNPSDPRFPTLMGWNGSTTYGLRVDSARISDTAANATLATTALYLDGQGKVDYIRNMGTVALANIDNAVSNGFYMIQNGNDQSSLLAFNTGGSNGTTQYRHTYSGTMEFRNRTDNNGWTAWKRVWTTQDFAGVDEGTGSATVVKRTVGGYINATYFNQSSPNSENNSVAQIMTSNGDGYLRKAEMGWFCGQIAGTIKNVENTILGVNRYKANYNTSDGSGAPLQVYSEAGYGATMAFHRGGYFAVNMGLDSDNVFRIGGWSASGNRLQLDMSGNLTMAGDITAFSDIRKKKNVATIENGLDKVLAMRGVTFDRIEDDKKSSGVIAQELEEIAPELVLTDNDGMKSVAYGNMVGYLIESIKTLEARIRELEGKQ